jgi:hypothetical protein
VIKSNNDIPLEHAHTAFAGTWWFVRRLLETTAVLPSSEHRELSRHGIEGVE